MLRGRWVFCLKLNEHGMTVKHKARFVIKGFMQRFHGVTYASTIGVDTINWMAAIAARLGLKMTSMDICGAFLNGNLDEPEYMESPVEFATILAQMAPKLAKMYLNSSLILMIVKSIYGMVQAAKAWQNTFSKAIKSFRAKNITRHP